MEPMWYYAHNGKQAGPISEPEVREMVNRGDLRGSDLVWKKGSPDWVEIRSIPGLLPDLEELPLEGSPLPPPPRRERSEARDRYRDDRDRDRDQDRYRDERDRSRDDPYRDRYRDDRDPRDDRRPGPDFHDAFASVKMHIVRVFTWDVRTIDLSENEKQTLTRAGITDETTQKYAAWRRSVMWVTMGPTFLFALLAMIGRIEDFKIYSVFGILVSLVWILSTFALPLGALFGALSYGRMGRSLFWLAAGSLIAFFVPILVALIPFSWMTKDQVFNREQAGLIGGLTYFILLLPTILSLLPGIARGCMRVKSLIPASVVPGWGFVFTSPMHFLFSLVIFILIYQASSNILLLFGLICWLGSPMLYLIRFRLLTTALTRKSDIYALRSMRIVVLIVNGVGIFLIVVFLFSGTIGGRTIMGFDRNVLIKAWDIDFHSKWIEFVCRSFLMTVLFADLMIRMNYSIWRQERSFFSSEAARDYHDAMKNLGVVMGSGDPLIAEMEPEPNLAPDIRTLSIIPEPVHSRPFTQALETAPPPVDLPDLAIEEPPFGPAGK